MTDHDVKLEVLVFDGCPHADRMDGRGRSAAGLAVVFGAHE
jgi:hypothetical protein